METNIQPKPGRVLIVGATGFVGRRLIPELVKKNVPLRLLARKPAGLGEFAGQKADIEFFQGDVVANSDLGEALSNVETAYYLVHSMGGKTMTRNEVVCKNNEIDTCVPITKTTFADAVLTAHSEETKGPGVTGY